jgi:hypothetical protein
MRTGLWPGGNSQGWEIVSRGSNPCPAPASNVGCVAEASFKEQGGGDRPCGAEAARDFEAAA